MQKLPSTATGGECPLGLQDEKQTFAAKINDHLLSHIRTHFYPIQDKAGTNVSK